MRIHDANTIGRLEYKTVMDQERGGCYTAPTMLITVSTYFSLSS
jgi:hypothetical protein